MDTSSNETVTDNMMGYPPQQASCRQAGPFSPQTGTFPFDKWWYVQMFWNFLYAVISSGPWQVHYDNKKCQWP